jgi:hypothetical protein
MKFFLRQTAALVKLSFLELWRRNDVFALVLLALALMAPLSMATPFGAAGASRCLDEVALLLVWAFSLFVSIGAGQRLFRPEFESRTVYPLFSKPVSRTRILAGKYLGALASAWSALALFYALFTGSALLRGTGFGAALPQAIALHAAFVALAVALSLLGSLVMSASANSTLCAIALAGMFFFGRRLPDFAAGAGGIVSWLVRAAYAIGPHAEFFDMRQRLVHGWGAIDPLAFAAVLAYAAAYTAALLCVAAAVLKRKRL